ncbi:MAG: hypothetical protein A3I05_06580 [Deltaproteobacteria bacterium RIFCSPLOWO2_02_FULL_44_10]|nr:MAG: hypothetical protein A3C46_06780 [Deltaproteobacteria bacterium RIFCSPHIGHO2_02_FULL_44_16]OGQ46698.1 MAG: hypothetical protein A3I05_06580 [Deltaproteobacteria bacterium RIFCSPLOWO2_02_FULL_44_10]
MFQRILTTPKTSILLLGPRGTGKSTWIRKHFPHEPTYNLLTTSEALRLSRDPSLLFHELEHLSPDSWVVIDEVQKVPELLNEVHRLMEEKKLRFILCGSSARKLKRAGTNLLAGRARLVHFFPLTSKEIDFDFKPSHAIEHGMLPTALTAEDPKSYLTSYAEVYLKEEIKEEALTRNIGSFARFLEVAARQNGQVTNVSDIARDAGVARQTVQGFFEILVDTLIGSWLQAWKLKRATKQIAHPKFYFFDSGVARSLSGRLPYPPLPEEIGALLETLLHHELVSYFSYSGLNYPLTFWRSHDDVEVDFFFETDRGYVAIECKSASIWKKDFQKGLHRMKQEVGKSKVKCIGVYLGERRAQYDDVSIYPLKEFLQMLWSGDIC